MSEQAPVDPKCIFCKIVAGTIPSHKVYEDDTTLAFLDIFPAVRGHTLVIPKLHAVELDDMPSDVLMATIQVAQTVARRLRVQLGADGLNVRQNNGRAAGQDVFHYHVHLLPRWTNDNGVHFGRKDAPDHVALAELAASLRA